MATTPELTGPLGKIQEAFEELAGVLKDSVVGAVTSVGTAFKDMGAAITSVLLSSKSLLTSFADIGKAITSFGKSVGSMGLALGAVGGAVVGIGMALGEFVKKANPAVFDQFMLAVNDLMGVIGKALVPLFQTVFIPIVRLLGDVLMNLAPLGTALAQAMKPVMEVFNVIGEIVGRALAKVGEVAMNLAPVFETLGNVFLTVVGAIQPIFDLLIDLLGGVLVEAAKLLAEAAKMAAPFIMAFARVISDVVQFISNGIRQLLALIGIDLPNAPGVKPGSGVGAAARQASHSGLEDVVKQAQRTAFSLGTASKEDPAQKTANHAAGIAKRADEIYSFIRELPSKMWEFIKNLPQMIWDFMKDLPDLIAKAIRGGATLAEHAFLRPDTPAGRGSQAALSIIPGANVAVGAFEFGRSAVRGGRAWYERNAPDILPRLW